jgi:hypothetical protein
MALRLAELTCCHARRAAVSHQAACCILCAPRLRSPSRSALILLCYAVSMLASQTCPPVNCVCNVRRTLPRRRGSERRWQQTSSFWRRWQPQTRQPAMQLRQPTLPHWQPPSSRSMTLSCGLSCRCWQRSSVCHIFRVSCPPAVCRGAVKCLSLFSLRGCAQVLLLHATGRTRGGW